MTAKQPIAAFRKTAGLTIEEFARQIGVDRTTVIRWEKGAPRIPVKRLERAKKILNASGRELRPDIFEAAE